MKKIALISALAVSGLFYNNADAQIRLSLGLRLPGVHVAVNTPVYAEYNAGDDYYYLPDVDAYYSVAEQCYYYNDGYNWVSATYLPGQYRNYDWRNARNYEVRAHRPYLNADVYRERYRGNVNNWGRNDNRYDNRTYANRDNRNDYRDDRQHFDNRNDQHFDNHNWNNRGRDDQRFDNHEQGTFTRPSQQNRSDNNYSQPNQSNHAQGNYNQPSQSGRNQEQPARGQDQPTRQNGNSQQQRGNNAGSEHFTDNHDRSNNGHDRLRS